MLTRTPGVPKSSVRIQEVHAFWLFATLIQAAAVVDLESERDLRASCQVCIELVDDAMAVRYYHTGLDEWW